MTDIKNYAINELTRIGMYNSGDEMNDAMCEHILKIATELDSIDVIQFELDDI